MRCLSPKRNAHLEALKRQERLWQIPEVQLEQRGHCVHLGYVRLVSDRGRAILWTTSSLGVMVLRPHPKKIGNGVQRKEGEEAPRNKGRELKVGLLKVFELNSPPREGEGVAAMQGVPYIYIYIYGRGGETVG